MRITPYRILYFHYHLTVQLQHGNRAFSSSQRSVVQYNLPFSLPSWQCNHFVSVPINLPCPDRGKKLTGGQLQAEREGAIRAPRPPAAPAIPLQLACRFCYLDNSSRSS